MSARRIDRQRLAALLGMVGSDHDGEALNAARLADRMVRQSGATWFQVLELADMSRAHEGPPVGWRGLISECLRKPCELTPWERRFLQSLQAFRRPSERQLDTLREIAARVAISRAAA